MRARRAKIGISSHLAKQHRNLRSFRQVCGTLFRDLRCRENWARILASELAWNRKGGKKKKKKPRREWDYVETTREPERKIRRKISLRFASGNRREKRDGNRGNDGDGTRMKLKRNLRRGFEVRSFGGGDPRGDPKDLRTQGFELRVADVNLNPL